jgi:hypothetical protein
MRSVKNRTVLITFLMMLAVAALFWIGSPRVNGPGEDVGPLAPPVSIRDAGSASARSISVDPTVPESNRGLIQAPAVPVPPQSRTRILVRGSISPSSRSSWSGGEARVHPDLNMVWPESQVLHAAVDEVGHFVADMQLFAYDGSVPGPYANGLFLVSLDCASSPTVEQRFRLQDAMPCTLPDGVPTRCIDLVFELEPAAVITGKVVGRDDRGLPDVVVALLRAGETSQPYAELTRTRTDVAGRFRLRARPSGACLVVAATLDLQPAALRISADVAVAQSVPTIVLESGFALSGRVTDPLPFRVSVQASAQRDNGETVVPFDGAPSSELGFHGDVPFVAFKEADCHKDASFAIDGLSHRSYCLQLIGTRRGGATVGGLPPPPCFVPPVRDLSVGANGARVIFEVMHAGGPVEGALVRFDDELRAAMCPTGYQGSVDYLVPPGRDLQVRIEHPKFSSRTMTIHTPAMGETLVQHVELEPNGSTARLLLRIQAGDPPVTVDHASISVSRKGADGALEFVGSASGRPQEDRWIVDELPSGRVTVVIEPDDMWKPDRAMLCNETLDIDLAADKSTERTVMVRPGGLIRIDARDAVGGPAHARIALRTEGGDVVAVKSMIEDASTIRQYFMDTPGATPFLLVPALPTGTYDLDFTEFEPDAKPVTIVIHVKSGTIVDQSVRLP